MRPRASMALLAVVALAASACGSRVSPEQAAAEARQDVLGAGSAAGPGADGVSALDTGPDGSGDAGGLGARSLAAGQTGSGQGRVAGASGTAAGQRAGGGGAVSCTPGGASDVGVTATEIRVGNISTQGGPVPGLFRGSIIGTIAAAEYLNSIGGICGRRVVVVTGDDYLDSGRNRSEHLRLKDQVFAFVGSFSVNDDGGASVLEDCGCPDVGAALSRVRFNLPNHYSHAPIPNGWRGGPGTWYKQRFPEAVTKKVAFFVSAVESARVIARNHREVMESLGYEIVYGREVGPNEQNFTNDVIQMSNKGVRAIMWQGDVGNMARLARDMNTQGFKVDLANWGNAIYDDNAFRIAPPAALEGALIDATYAMFRGEDAERIPEVALFNEWMRRIDPRQTVDLFALFGWVAMRLFAQTAEAAGPNPTRAALLAELGRVTSFDANGLTAPVNVAAKRPSDCFMIARITGGRFVREAPTDSRNFICDVAPFVYTE